MLDRDLLKDIGFELGSGWDMEVWVYKGEFWVYFTDDESVLLILESRSVLASCSRKEFFKKFIDALEDDLMSRARITW
jgi:hypothetical protein